MEKTGDLYQKLTDMCKAKNLSLREACKRAGVNYITVTKWKDSTPSTVKTVDKLIEVINSHK